METIIIKSIVCSGIVWLFYTLFLEKGKRHHFNRFYLLLSPVAAFVVPFLSLPFSGNIFHFISDWLPGLFQSPQAEHIQGQAATAQTDVISWLLLLYTFITTLFMIRYLKGITGMLRLRNQHEKIKSASFTYVLLPGNHTAFSFLNYLFCSKTEYLNNNLSKAVLIHEKVHIEQRHTWDILLIEFIQVIWWFNPFIVPIKKSIRLNHEFLADSQASLAFETIPEYQHLLLNHLSQSNHFLTSGFNYSQTKKRIMMMNKKENFRKSAGSILLVIPFAVLVLFSFAEANKQEVLPPPPPEELKVPPVPAVQDNKIPPPPPPVEIMAPLPAADAVEPQLPLDPVAPVPAGELPPPPPPVEAEAGSNHQYQPEQETNTGNRILLQWNYLLNKPSGVC